ncbi:MAG: hypothetical protein LBD78_08720 [Spirochaetaceae bacterium]|jgi:hypothetical protein|nr:hypothetical protein [Spirochaetaceae bacterium]
MAKPQSRIGTERESSLHRTLKFQYAGTTARTEASLGGYVCDGISESGEIFEIQTGSFGPLKQKVRELSALGMVRIVHPIIVTNQIELYNGDGALLSRRKSPRKGTIWDLFKALLYAPELPLNPNIRIELVLVDVRERRIRDGRGSWRRRGISIVDRELTACRGSVPLYSIQDYGCFIPFSKHEEFTVKLLGDRARISPAIARKALYVLTKLGVTERIGKEGNAFRYIKKIT